MGLCLKCGRWWRYCGFWWEASKWQTPRENKHRLISQWFSYSLLNRSEDSDTSRAERDFYNEFIRDRSSRQKVENQPMGGEDWRKGKLSWHSPEVWCLNVYVISTRSQGPQRAGSISMISEHVCRVFEEETSFWVGTCKYILTIIWVWRTKGEGGWDLISSGQLRWPLVRYFMPGILILRLQTCTGAHIIAFSGFWNTHCSLWSLKYRWQSMGVPNTKTQWTNIKLCIYVNNDDVCTDKNVLESPPIIWS